MFSRSPPQICQGGERRHQLRRPVSRAVGGQPKRFQLSVPAVRFARRNRGVNDVRQIRACPMSLGAGGRVSRGGANPRHSEHGRMRYGDHVDDPRVRGGRVRRGVRRRSSRPFRHMLIMPQTQALKHKGSEHLLRRRLRRTRQTRQACARLVRELPRQNKAGFLQIGPPPPFPNRIAGSAQHRVSRQTVALLMLVHLRSGPAAGSKDRRTARLTRADNGPCPGSFR